MTIGEKIYTAIVISFAGFCLCGFGVFIYLLTRQEDAGVFIIILFVYAVFLVFFGVTAAINIVKKQLLLIPTIVQCIMLMITVWGIPVGIWGIYLLYRRYRPGEVEVDS